MTALNKKETIPKLDDLIMRMVADLHEAYLAPGTFEASALAGYATAIESLVNARLRLPLDTFAP